MSKVFVFWPPIPSVAAAVATASAAAVTAAMSKHMLRSAFWAYQNVYERVKSATISRVCGNVWWVGAECF